MGDCQNEDLRVNFDRTLKLKILGSKVTTDAGLLAYRELDEALDLTAMGAKNLQDSRLGQNKQHGLLPLLRQSIYNRLAVLSNNTIRRRPTEDAGTGPAIFGLVLGFQAVHKHRMHFIYVVASLRMARQMGRPMPVQAARA